MSEPSRRLSNQQATLVRGRTPISRWLARLTRIVVLLLVLFVAWRLFEQIGWRQLWLRIESASRPALMAAVGLLVVRIPMLYLRWVQALEAEGIRPPWVFGLATQLAAVLVNHLTPTARLLGGVLRARGVSRQLGCSFPRVLATVLVDQVSHQLVIGTITWLSLVAVAGWMGLTGLAVGLALGLTVAIVALVIWRQRRRATERRPLVRLIGLRVERTGRRLGPLIASGRELMEVLRRSLSDVPLQARMALLGLVVFSLNAGAQWLIFQALGTAVGFWATAATIALGLTAGLVSGMPGGVATTEAAMIGLYVALGVDRIDATAGVLLYRGLHYALVLTAGLPALVFSESATGRIRWATNGCAGGALPETETPVVESRRDPAG